MRRRHGTGSTTSPSRRWCWSATSMSPTTSRGPTRWASGYPRLRSATSAARPTSRTSSPIPPASPPSPPSSPPRAPSAPAPDRRYLAGGGSAGGTLERDEHALDRAGPEPALDLDRGDGPELPAGPAVLVEHLLHLVRRHLPADQPFPELDDLVLPRLCHADRLAARPGVQPVTASPASTKNTTSRTARAPSPGSTPIASVSAAPNIAGPASATAQVGGTRGRTASSRAERPGGGTSPPGPRCSVGRRWDGATTRRWCRRTASTTSTVPTRIAPRTPVRNPTAAATTSSTAPDSRDRTRRSRGAGVGVPAMPARGAAGTVRASAARASAGRPGVAGTVVPGPRPGAGSPRVVASHGSGRPAMASTRTDAGGRAAGSAAVAARTHGASQSGGPSGEAPCEAYAITAPH